jgi:hypothetical protein
MADAKITDLLELDEAPAATDVVAIVDIDAAPATTKKITATNLVDNNSNVSANTTHRGQTDNPHAVTKTQVGLSNVPNTDATDRDNHTGTQLAATISNFAATVRSTVLTGLTIVNSAVNATDSVLSAIGKLQGQIDNLNFSKVIRTDYFEGTTVDPSTTATTSGTADVIAEMTDTFTPNSADDVIDVYFSGTFGESVTNKDHTVHVGIFIDGNLIATTERSQTVKTTDDDDKISSIQTQWSGTLSAVSHTIDVRFWIIGDVGATAVAIGARRNLIIKETDE